MTFRILAVAVLAAGCGAGPGDAPCRDGTSTACPCDGGEGVQVCEAGRFAACDCMPAGGFDLPGLPGDPVGNADRILDFGTVAFPATAERRVRVRNASLERLVVAVSAPAPPFGVAPAELVIAPRGEDELLVTVTPAAGGQLEGTLRLATPTGSVVVRLRARAVIPRVTCAASPVDYGAVPLGEARTRTAATCRNLGEVAATLAFEFAGEGAAAFSVAPGVVLPPGGEATPVEATFRPEAAGDARATLRLGAGGAIAAALELRGRGVAGALEFSSSDLDFGNVGPSRREFLHLGVRNVSAEAVSVGPLRQEGSLAFFADPFQLLRLPAHGEAFVAVQFWPGAEGTFEGTLIVPHGEAAIENRIPLRGRSGGPALRCEPALDVGHASLATPRRGRFTCRNDGTDAAGDRPAVVSEVGSDSSEFAVGLVDRDAPVALAPGESVELEVTFAPVAEGRRLGLVRVHDAVNGAAPSVNVAGWGVLLPGTCELRVTPPTLTCDFEGEMSCLQRVQVPEEDCLVHAARTDAACGGALRVVSLEQELVDGVGVRTDVRLALHGPVECDLHLEVADVESPERRLRVRVEAATE